MTILDLKLVLGCPFIGYDHPRSKVNVKILFRRYDPLRSIVSVRMSMSRL